MYITLSGYRNQPVVRLFHKKNVLIVTLAFYAIIEQLSSLEVNIATPWMISRIKKVDIELFFYFFSESRHDFRKFLPVKQVIKKCGLKCRKKL